jgi:hypothetical protein
MLYISVSNVELSCRLDIKEDREYTVETPVVKTIQQEKKITKIL